jgi:hypothetical protein
MLTAQRGLRFSEREVIQEEINKLPKQVNKIVVIGVHRGGKLVDLEEMDRTKLKSGDRLIFLEKTN